MPDCTSIWDVFSSAVLMFQRGGGLIGAPALEEHKRLCWAGHPAQVAGCAQQQTSMIAVFQKATANLRESTWFPLDSRNLSLKLKSLALYISQETRQEALHADTRRNTQLSTCYSRRRETEAANEARRGETIRADPSLLPDPKALPSSALIS